MRWLTRLLAAAAVAGLSLGVPTALASVASASTVPVVYQQFGWSTPSVRPQWITIGQGGSPEAHTWSWTSWGAKTATAKGTLWTDNCVPNCALGKESYYKLYVTLYWVKSHNGRAYYYAMSWYTPGFHFPGHGSTVWLHFSPEGGTAPGWH